ncbi:MAG TPA: hypothetical protein VMJ70_15585 [Candidatus Sulfotelmatobacter sp.]|nr:hypothetical protein [Candidatus Sulfotelmatobacter sp.]
MNRSTSMSMVVCVALMVSTHAEAARLGKGRSLVLVGVSGHRGEFASPFGSPFLPLESSEVGGTLAYGRFIDDDWSVGIAGTYYAGREKAANNYPSGAPNETTTLHSHTFSARIGTDRFAFVNDNVGLFTGPGILVTQGRAKIVDAVSPPGTGGGTSQGPNSTGFGVDWRIGMYARLNGSAALYAHVGQSLAYNSGKYSDGDVSWWSSSPEGSLGLAFDF